jgi:hypothetical protein
MRSFIAVVIASAANATLTEVEHAFINFIA